VNLLPGDSREEEADVAKLARQVLRRLGMLAPETPPVTEDRRRALTGRLGAVWFVL